MKKLLSILAGTSLTLAISALAEPSQENLRDFKVGDPIIELERDVPEYSEMIGINLLSQDENTRLRLEKYFTTGAEGRRNLVYQKVYQGCREIGNYWFLTGVYDLRRMSFFVDISSQINSLPDELIDKVIPQKNNPPSLEEFVFKCPEKNREENKEEIL